MVGTPGKKIVANMKYLHILRTAGDKHASSSNVNNQFNQKTSMIEMQVCDRHANEYTAMKRLGGDITGIWPLPK